jgi:hypothetical protein
MFILTLQTKWSIVESYMPESADDTIVVSPRDAPQPKFLSIITISLSVLIISAEILMYLKP